MNMDIYIRLTSTSTNLRNEQVDTKRTIFVLEIGFD